MLSGGRMLKRTHSDRGILEVDDGRFIKKVPQTSVAPTYKLTLPSEFVLANLSHLIDQQFDLTDKEGKDVWRVALLPRRNKSKYEYTLQGWKAFALSHSVQTGDRLQIELLPDSHRMRADIVKRAALKERVASDPGPESPILPDMAVKRLINSEEPTMSSSDEEQLHEQPRGSGASWSSVPTVEPRAQPQPPKRRPDAAMPRAAIPHHVKFEALQALSGVLAQQLQAASSPRGGQPDAGRAPDARARGADFASGGAFSAFAEANRQAEQAEDDTHSGSRRPQRGAAGSRAHESSEDEQDNMQPYTPTFLRKSKGLGIVSPHHPKRQRSSLMNGLSGHGAQADRTGGGKARDLDTGISGMALLSSAIELDAGATLSYTDQPNPPAENVSKQTMSSEQGTMARPFLDGAGNSAQLLAAAEEVLETQTSRGLIVVSALLKIAARLVAPSLLADAGEEAATELTALHSELKEHTNSVLDAMWHMRNLPKVWK